MKTAAEHLQGAQAYVWPEKFAYVQAKATMPSAFVSIVDRDEVTVVIDQTKIITSDAITVDKDWRLITINVVFEFSAIGITAAIATALADAGVNIMPIAAFSRDHILVKDAHLEKAVAALATLGVTVQH